MENETSHISTPLIPNVDTETHTSRWAESGPFDGVTGNWPSISILLIWIVAGLVLYLMIGNVMSVLILAIQGVSVEDLVQNPQSILIDYGSSLLGANAIGLAIGLGGVALVASWLESSRPLTYLRISRCRASELGLSTLGFFCLLPVVLSAGILNEQLPLPEFLQTLEEQQMEIVNWLGSGGGIFALNLLLVAATPAIFEEMFFRGFVQRRAERAMGVVGAILFTGILFGVFHLRLTQVLPLAILGCYFVYVTWRTGSLIIPVILHFLNNGLSLAVSKWGPSSVADPEIIPLPLIIGSMFAFALCLILIHRNHGKLHT